MSDRPNVTFAGDSFRNGRKPDIRFEKMLQEAGLKIINGMPRKEAMGPILRYAECLNDHAMRNAYDEVINAENDASAIWFMTYRIYCRLDGLVQEYGK